MLYKDKIIYLFYKCSTKKIIMGYSIKFVFRKIIQVDDTNTVGYIFLQKIEDRKKTYKSLGLPRLDKKFWDEDKQRVKKNSSIDYASFNNIIDNTHRNLLNDGGSLTTLVERTDNRSFLKYIEDTIDGVKFKSKHGTRKKYNTVIKKFKGYLDINNRSNFLFKDLTVDFLDGFQSYMLESGMTQNCVTNYLKILHSFVRRSMVDRELMNTNNPFNNFKFEKKLIRNKETLTDEEIRYLLNVKVKDKKLDVVRKLFLFQFFTGGMRVSDLLTLRFRNFTNNKLSYRMFKTNHPIQFELSESILDILSDFITIKPSSNKINLSISVPFDFLHERKKEYDFNKKSEDILKNNKKNPFSVPLPPPPKFVFLEESDFGGVFLLLDSLVDSYLKSLTELDLNALLTDIDEYIKGGGKINFSTRSFIYDGFYKNKIDLIYKFKNRLLETLVELRRLFYLEMKNQLHQLGTSIETKNNFVFGKLKEVDFIDSMEQENFSVVSEHLYDKISKTGIAYNRDLKRLQKALNFNKTLKSHLPRTTFTNIMMKGKVSHRDISNTLGHSSISITDEYIKSGFNNDGVDSVIKGTSDSFRKN